MAISNQQRIGNALDLLRAGLGPFVEREFAALNGADPQAEANRYLGTDRLWGG